MSIVQKSRLGEAPAETQVCAFPTLTVETFLYLAIGILAGLLRLWALGTWPLRLDEIAQAMGAWNLARGLPASVAHYSPILMTGNLIVFSLFTASDASARLWPALFGTVLSLAPALLRERLGRIGALVSSLLLALSPTLLFTSRSLDGRIIAVAAGMLLTIAIFRVATGGGPRFLMLAGAGLALGILSAPLFYPILLILLLGLCGMWLLRRQLAIGDIAQAQAAWKKLRETPAAARSAGVFTLALLGILGTAFTFNLDGLGAAAGLLPAWLHSFAWSSQSLPPFTPLWAILIYETLLVIFGTVGLVSGVRKRDPLALMLGWWVIAGLILSLVAGGWSPADLALLAAPLALLAGASLGQLFSSVAEQPLAEGEWLIVGVAIPLGVYAFIELAAYMLTGQSLHALAAIAAPVVFALVIALVTLWMNWRQAVRGVALVVTLAGALWLISNAFVVNHSADPDRRDWFSMSRVDVGLRDLIETMERYSSQTKSDVGAAPGLVVGTELRWLKWHLRGFHDIKFIDSFDTSTGRTLVISPADQAPPLGETYTGQDIAVRSEWRPAGLTERDWWKWLIYRKTPEAGQVQKVILWVQRPAGQ